MKPATAMPETTATLDITIPMVNYRWSTGGDVVVVSASERHGNERLEQLIQTTTMHSRP